MKRIFSLLAALMCLSVSSVWAQNATTSLGKVASDVTAIQNLESGYYVIHATAENHQCYIYYSGNTKTAAEGVIRMYRGSVNTDTIGTHGSLAYVWYVSVSADKKRMTIQCAGNGAFWPKQADTKNMTTAKTFDNAAVYNYPESDANESGIRLYQEGVKISNKDVYIHKSDFNDTDYKLGYWNGPGQPNGVENSSACCFKFYKFTPTAGITTQATPVALFKYKQQIEGEETNVVADGKGLVGSQTANPWEYSDGVYEAPTLSVASVTANTGDVDVNFVKKTNPRINLDEYYKLKIKDGYRVVVGGNVNTADNSSKNDFANYYNPNKHWKFVTDGLQVKMVCGDGKYVHLSNPNLGNNQTEKATFVEGAENGTKFYLNNSTKTGHQPDGFVLKYAGNTYLGDHGANPNHSLGTWNSTDAASGDGSCFAVDGDPLSPEDLHILQIRLNVSQPTDIASNVLRVANSNQVTEAKKQLEPLQSGGADITPKKLVDIYNSAFTAQPEADAYYRIKNLGTTTNIYPSTINIEANTVGEIPSTNDNARVFELKTATDAMAPQLWQFVANGDGTFKIKNANTKCAWANQTATGKNFDMTTAENTDVHAGNFSILAVPVSGAASEGTIASVNNGVSTFLIRNGLSAVKATDDAHLQLAESGAYSDNVNYWQIEKVTSIPVTITPAKYATVGYPFNVKVTDDKVRVYYAKEATNGVMKLTEATDQIIPAYQGAILYYEGEGSTTANLDIVSETGAGFVDNILTASTAKRTGFTTKTTYGLSNKDGKVSFRLNTDNYVPANKSYLLASKYNSGSGNAQQLLFSFDNVVEGIDNAVVDGQNANKVYYDLQGRRVMYPAHGIFVTENGEKVFIK